MAIGLVYHKDFLLHQTGDAHPERPERLTAIIEAIKDAGLVKRMSSLPFRAARPEHLYGIHEEAYVELVRLACQQEMTFLGSPDTKICSWSYDVAMLAIGGVLAACDEAMAGRVRRSFCAVRPPGHHAERDQAMGFCLFNNVAIAADYLIRHHGLPRVAIVDFDVHHGNGTQHIFETRDDVLYISLHQHPRTLFPGTGFECERGAGPGEGFTLNIPLPPGAKEDDYRRAFDEKVTPALEQYRPEFLLISAGFDALRTDPLGRIDLTAQSFGWMTRELVAVAERQCGGRVVSVLEGGYDLGGVGRAAVEHVRGMMREAES